MNLPKKSLIIALLLTVTATVLAQTFKYETVANDPMGARIYTLDNGLKIYLSRNTEKPRIQTYIAVRTGSRNDPHETTGLAHYLEHLMFKGTTHFGTSNLKAEQPLLDSIEHRFEVYRTIKDPAARKAYYQQIDSISQLAAKYNIPKAPTRIHPTMLPAMRRISHRTRLTHGPKCRATDSRIWSSADSTPSWRLSTRSTISIWHPTEQRHTPLFLKSSVPHILTALNRQLVPRSISRIRR